MKGEIERIREKKIEKDGTVYYLVKYHGYSEKRNTWEPYTKLRDMMTKSVNDLIEQFEEELNKKYKENSRINLGGLTTITKKDETDVPNYKKKYFFTDMRYDTKFRSPDNKVNNGSINSNDDIYSLYQPKEIIDMRYDKESSKMLLKVKWIPININNSNNLVVRETEENYNDFKVKYPHLLFSYLEKKVSANNIKGYEEEENENEGEIINNANIADKSLYDIVNI